MESKKLRLKILGCYDEEEEEQAKIWRIYERIGGMKKDEKRHNEADERMKDEGENDEDEEKKKTVTAFAVKY